MYLYYVSILRSTANYLIHNVTRPRQHTPPWPLSTEYNPINWKHLWRKVQPIYSYKSWVIVEIYRNITKYNINLFWRKYHICQRGFSLFIKGQVFLRHPSPYGLTSVMDNPLWTLCFLCVKWLRTHSNLFLTIITEFNSILGIICTIIISYLSEGGQKFGRTHKPNQNNSPPHIRVNMPNIKDPWPKYNW